jgi:hypothetical protein
MKIEILSDSFESTFLDLIRKSNDQLQKKHPRNKNIEAKIRQQLQELGDLGLIDLWGAGITGSCGGEAVHRKLFNYFHI